MKKKIAIALALCLLMLGIMVTPVFAVAHKVDLDNVSTDPGSGFVIGNSCQGPLSHSPFDPTGPEAKGAGLLRISLKDALPNVAYEVRIRMADVPMDWIGLGLYLETNGQGNGNFIGDKLLGQQPQTARMEYALFRDDVMRFVTAEPVTNIIK